jgi:membrane-associated protease RseP (regulator of RpoE activity)
MLILYERLKESSGVPLWKFAEDGVIVVDTIPLSPAEKIGIKSGDKLVGINNKPVNSIEDVMQIMGDYLNYIWIDVINLKGEKRLIEFANYQGGIKELGIITVPKDDNNIVFVEENNSNLFKRMTKRFKK